LCELIPEVSEVCVRQRVIHRQVIHDRKVFDIVPRYGDIDDRVCRLGTVDNITHYSYSKDHHNFLGYGSNVVWRDDGMDNLYRAREDYTYSTVESLGGTSSDNSIRHTSRTFNRFHLLMVEETVQNDNVMRNETAYHLLPGREPARAWPQVARRGDSQW